MESGEIFRSDYIVANSDAVETYRNLLDNTQNFSMKNWINANRRAAVSFCCWASKKISAARASQHLFFRRLQSRIRRDFQRFASGERSDNLRLRDFENRRNTIAGKLRKSVCFDKRALHERANRLEKRSGKLPRFDCQKVGKFRLGRFGKSIEFEQIITPEDFEKKYRTNRGSIYGVSSNGIFSAFLRVPNRATRIKNLYFVGGATHPGGGMPLVLLSGKMAADLILRES